MNACSGRVSHGSVNVATGRFYDGARDRQAKAPMYIHDLAMNEAHDRIYAVGHHKIAVLRLEK